ncbi:MAG TPA: hypothetical protein VIW27_06515 [Gammaproteobacteria bacterium]|jgi:TPR repeat protein
MPDQDEPESPPRRNPLLWIALVVAGLIVYVVTSTDRGGKLPVENGSASIVTSGSVERTLLVSPGMRAREYIAGLRAAGEPYPLAEAHQKAGEFLREGNLADAHLLYFFSAREDHLPSIMTMGEMSDPLHFSAENALLDHADAVQAYKWYSKAASLGQQTAEERIGDLRQWASVEAANGNPEARQLLLNFQ